MANGKDTRGTLIDVTVNLVRERGFTALRVDEVCKRAGVTKGAFFHYFSSREDIARAAGETWRANVDQYFIDAGFNPADPVIDPVRRLLDYAAFRLANIEGTITNFCCYPGTFVQDAWHSDPELNAAVASAIHDHVELLELLIRQALAVRPDVSVDARDLAIFAQGSVQGAFVMAKAGLGAEGARACLRQFKSYLELLFAIPAQNSKGGMPT